MSRVQSLKFAEEATSLAHFGTVQILVGNMMSRWLNREGLEVKKVIDLVCNVPINFTVAMRKRVVCMTRTIPYNGGAAITVLNSQFEFSAFTTQRDLGSTKHKVHPTHKKGGR